MRSWCVMLCLYGALLGADAAVPESKEAFYRATSDHIKNLSFQDGFRPFYTCDAVFNPLGKMCKDLYECYQNSLRIHDDPIIPELIHFVWLGSPLPEKNVRLVATWQKYHPTWTIKVWTDEDVPAFLLHNQIAFDMAKNYGEKSDIFRYEILYRFGGLYLDTDFECLQPFDVLHRSCEFYTGTIGGDFPDHYLLNGLIAAKPEHPILKACIENLRIGNGDDNPHRIFGDTGPHHFSQMFLDTVTLEDQGKVVAFPPMFFYPFNPPARNTTNQEELKKQFAKPETLAIHYWYTSWQR